jgi:demethylmenaquinone methyltransferase/2-methoxy-6-polyprenyl-1,4-benzoquinol methylase
MPRTMFDRIAPVYDVMNRVMTAGLDMRWRRLAAESVVRKGDRVLDAACGTGDLAIADQKAGASRVTGLDFSEKMLERARRKAPLNGCRATCSRCRLRMGRSMPRRSASACGTSKTSSSAFASSVGCSVPAAALRSSRSRSRAVRSGPSTRSGSTGSSPSSAGALGGDAYTYLPASVKRFPTAERLADLLRDGRLHGRPLPLLAGSIVALHTGEAA